MTSTVKPPTPAKVTLPVLPFDVPPAVEDETKPRAPAITGTLTAEDKRWLRGIARVRG